jgi:glycosyltransferase involved in cell wall biosynthesis
MRGVLFDARWITPGMTGVGMVAWRTLLAIPERDRTGIGVVLPAAWPDGAAFRGFRIFRSRAGLTRHPRTELFEQFGLPWICLRHGYGALVSFENRTPVFHPGIRTYAYIHDLAFIKHPRFNGPRYNAFLFAHYLAARRFASGIVTVSRAVGNELEARLPAGKRVFVVHNADSGLASKPAMIPSGLPEAPYFLAVGVTNPRKNLKRLIEGFAMFNADGAYRLVLTGDHATIERHRLESGADGIVNLGFAEEAALPGLYRNAAGFVYPSLDEGFGIPLLDAALLGCPVLCSDIPAFREVMEDEAVYFDPSDSGAIARAMSRTVAAPRIADASRLRERFSWEKSARRLLDIVRA